MDTLEATSSASRLKRTWFVCLLIYMVWLLFLAPKPIPQQPQNTSDSGVAQQEIPQVAPEKPAVEEKVSAPKSTIAAHHQDFSDKEKEEKERLFSSKVTSENGSISQFSLLQYAELPENNPWWSWIFGGKGDFSRKWSRGRWRTAVFKPFFLVFAVPNPRSDLKSEETSYSQQFLKDTRPHAGCALV